SRNHLYLRIGIRRYRQDIRVDFTRQFANRIDEEVSAAFAAFHLEEAAFEVHGADAAGKAEAHKIKLHIGVEPLVLDQRTGSRVADIKARLVDAQIFLRRSGDSPCNHQTQRPSGLHSSCSSSRDSSKKADHSLSG